MEKRRLGRTGHLSTVVIFGGAAFWEVDQETANETLEMALAAGVNHIDVAPQYGLGEERIGNWLPPHRDKFFLGCKTLHRESEAAWKELHVSLEKLKTDKFELYQLHAVTSMDELDKATQKGGAIETLQRARDEGLTQWLGITGHSMEVPKVQYEALQRFDFDTVMFPINPVLYANTEYRENTEKLLSLCADRDVGVMIIKAIGKGPWADKEKTYHTWYEPYDEQDMINAGVRFALSQRPVTGIPAAGDTRLLPKILEAAGSFTPMSEEEQEALIKNAEGLATIYG